MKVGDRLEMYCREFLRTKNNAKREEIAQEMLRFLAIHVGLSMPDSDFNLLALMGEMGFE